MSKRQADKRALRSLDGRRNAMWAVMRKLRQFTAVELQEQSGVTNIGCFLQGLRLANIVRIVRKGGATLDGLGLYELVDDRGVLAPRIDHNGKPQPPGEHERLWYAVKALGTFDLVGIAAAAEVEPSRAKAYLTKLAGAGYLEVTRRRGVPVSYALLPRMWTGRRAPEIHPDGVYDPNRNRMMTGAA